MCKMDECRGISLVPVACKAMCSIIHARLAHVVEEKNLVAEEQGGFRRRRGCRDQQRREDRVCKVCGNWEVEDIDHFVIRCEYVAEERVRMER